MCLLSPSYWGVVGPALRSVFLCVRLLIVGFIMPIIRWSAGHACRLFASIKLAHTRTNEKKTRTHKDAPNNRATFAAVCGILAQTYVQRRSLESMFAGRTNANAYTHVHTRTNDLNHNASAHQAGRRLWQQRAQEQQQQTAVLCAVCARVTFYVARALVASDGRVIIYMCHSTRALCSAHKLLNARART